MSSALKSGLYETLLSLDLRNRLDASAREGWWLEVRECDEALRPEVLARHVYALTRRALAAVPSGEGQLEEQVRRTNALVSLLSQVGAEDAVLAADQVASEAQVLREARIVENALAEQRPTIRPHLSLAESGLLVNGRRDYGVGTELAREIESADRIDLLCAFVRFAGLRLVREPLKDFIRRGGRLRVITTVYTGSTERRALDDLVALGAEVKVSFETDQTRLHAKAWLFHRNTGLHTAYIGSSNLTHSALVEGLEWNVRVSHADNAGILERVSATFEQYWSEPEFVSYRPEVDGARLSMALERERGGGASVTALERLVALNIEFEPKAHQRQMLEALEAERRHGHQKNLVVAATGTGKTWVAAFDYRGLRAQGYERLLFVAHRDEILQQSQQVFQLVLRDAAFGERLVAGERPLHGARHVFASVQSLQRLLETLSPEAYDVVVVDEFHHAEAPTYRRLLEHLRPRILLGLTATPDRADGQSVLGWFDGRIACDVRLWQALEQGLLCPFQYFGVHDGTDLSSVTFKRGMYAKGELESLYTGSDFRARRILQAVAEYVHVPQTMRALGFCVGVAHAELMARHFNAAGLKAVALHAGSPDGERREAVARLRRGELQAVFTVDLFNEGVDIPEVDTLLLLRPTESATIFLQQLGRGLRWSPGSGKSVLTVLDFIGQAHKSYRFDVRYRAIIGGTRRQLESELEHDFPRLPPGCAIRLDRIAQQHVLQNVRSAVIQARRMLVEELQALPPETRLQDFLRATGYELEEVYGRPSERSSFTALRREAGRERRPAGPQEAALARAMPRLLHVGDEERLMTWRTWLAGAAPPALAAPGSRQQRLQWMLFAALGFRKRPVSEWSQALGEVWACAPLREELVELLDLLADRSRRVHQPLEPGQAVPLASHATYGLYEVVAGYGVLGTKGMLRELREGVLWVEAHKTDLLFITLDKSDADFKPTTLYADYAVSPTLFHWESQNGTASASPTGRRYVEQGKRGTRVVLFARERKRDDRDESMPYLCLGPARYVSHESERPMRILWELENPMPADFFQATKVAAG
jgi:superfamily II DNA or RNA helicase/HKD family nuclease